MRKPNFFILGAPKCGTTSLAAWLSSHPNIFMTNIKEPTYFSFDIGNQRIRNAKTYEKLFKASKPEHKWVGEASTSYLFSKVAVPAIVTYTENPKFIVGVRNPIEMAYSLHNQRVYDGQEDEINFEAAWNLQNTRALGQRVPPYCPDHQLLQYGQWCKLGDQLRRLLSTVPRKSVFIYQLNDLQKNPRDLYISILKFLEIPDDNRLDFLKLNESKIRKHALAFKAAQRANQVIQRMGVRNLRLGLFEILDRVSQRPFSRPKLDDRLKKQMKNYFSEDITLLQHLTGFDLCP